MSLKRDVPKHIKAWVVFTGKTDIGWLKILKPGFRHCFLILNDGRRWLSFDPLASHVDIQTYYHFDSAYNLPDWLKKKGFTIIPALMRPAPRRAAPCMIFTCVEAVKRVLGIHCRRIVTPWQLYKFLYKQLTN
jgi:hypothetical protein